MDYYNCSPMNNGPTDRPESDIYILFFPSPLIYIILDRIRFFIRIVARLGGLFGCIFSFRAFVM